MPVTATFVMNSVEVSSLDSVRELLPNDVKHHLSATLIEDFLIIRYLEGFNRLCEKGVRLNLVIYALSCIWQDSKPS